MQCCRKASKLAGLGTATLLTGLVGGSGGGVGEITRATAKSPAASQHPNSRPRTVRVGRSGQNPGWIAIFML